MRLDQVSTIETPKYCYLCGRKLEEVEQPEEKFFDVMDGTL